MEVASPARLYSAAVGLTLLAAGILGFFASASFGSPGEVEPVLGGAFELNGWLNLLHAATGALGLLCASWAARPFALLAGILYAVAGVWGLSAAGSEILGAFPVAEGTAGLHLALGILGLAAAAGTQAPARRRSEARADAAGEGP